MTRAADLVYVEGEVLARTAKAILYRLGVCDEIWVPVEILNAMTTAREVGDKGWFVVPRAFVVREKITRFAV